jgi:hypothetical protein
MIDKLIEFILRAAGDKFNATSTPKAKAVRALLDIHNAMVDCHEAYLEWRVMNGRDLTGREYWDWERAVRHLRKVYTRVEDKLSIAAPVVADQVKGYWLVEAFASSLEVHNFDRIVERISPRDALLSFSDFEHAIESLRSFIRDRY